MKLNYKRIILVGFAFFLIPIAMPLAFNMAGGEATNLVYATIAAVMGGGCFGDTAPPCPTPPSCPLWVQAPTTWITLRLRCPTL